MAKTVHVVDSSIASDSRRFDQFARRGPGDVVIKLGAMCNGNAPAVGEIGSALGGASLDLLIIDGHGAPGAQGVAMGKDGAGVADNSAITLAAISGETSVWRTLRPLFSPQGAVVLKGCNTGRGEKGDALMRALAKTFGVPVTASDWYQLTGRTETVGHIRTAYPSGAIAEDRVSGLPNLSAVPLLEAVAILGAQAFGTP